MTILDRVKRIFMVGGGGSRQYTWNDVSHGLDVLALKVAKIGLSAQIVTPMFDGLRNGKRFTVNSETMPLVIILQDAIKFIYGRLGRCYFDGQSRGNKTASIEVLINQIFNISDGGENRKNTFRVQYDAISEKFNYAKKYQQKLKTFCNKHYAHTDIRPLEKIELEEVAISIPWDELVKLITYAKEILRDMFVVCQKPAFNYSEHLYQEYMDQFWKLINFTETKLASH